MEQIWNQVVERLSNPEVLFGLAVRFFGVFIVLIIVMIVLYLTGWVFHRLDKKRQAARSAADAGGPLPESVSEKGPVQTGAASPGSTVPDEVAVAVALALIPDEAAVAVALALTEAADEQGSGLHHTAGARVPTVWEEPGNTWKIVGRQQALFRKTALSRDITPKGE